MGHLGIVNLFVTFKTQNMYFFEYLSKQGEKVIFQILVAIKIVSATSRKSENCKWPFISITCIWAFKENELNIDRSCPFELKFLMSVFETFYLIIERLLMTNFISVWQDER